nr:hypothetical protein [Pengzhenrongella sicca]
MTSGSTDSAQASVAFASSPAAVTPVGVAGATSAGAGVVGSQPSVPARYVCAVWVAASASDSCGRSPPKAEPGPELPYSANRAVCQSVTTPLLVMFVQVEVVLTTGPSQELRTRT